MQTKKPLASSLHDKCHLNLQTLIFPMVYAEIEPGQEKYPVSKATVFALTAFLLHKLGAYAGHFWLFSWSLAPPTFPTVSKS